jgi:hypothetical protein
MQPSKPDFLAVKNAKGRTFGGAISLGERGYGRLHVEKLILR